MKHSHIQRYLMLIVVAAACLFCSSCKEEDATVYDDLLGSWTISGVTQSHPMTLNFYWDGPVMVCCVNGTEWSVTPDFGDMDGDYEVTALRDKEGVVTLRYSYEAYEEDYDTEQYVWVTHSTDFIYQKEDDNTMQLTETTALFNSNNKTYEFFRR